MIELSQKTGATSLEKCQSSCLSHPSCEHFTFIIGKGYCLLFDPDMTFSKVASSRFVSGSKECLIANEAAAKNYSKTSANCLENEEKCKQTPDTNEKDDTMYYFNSSLNGAPIIPKI